MLAERTGQPPPKPRPSRAKKVRREKPWSVRYLAGRYNALRSRRGEDDPETVAARLAWRQEGAVDTAAQWAERELTDDEAAAILAVLWPENE